MPAMIDLFGEQVITLAEASQLLPTRPTLQTLWRWRQKGVRGARLETALIGGRRVTSVESLQRFFAATSGTAEAPVTITKTNRQREAEIRRAEEELDHAGATLNSPNDDSKGV